MTTIPAAQIHKFAGSDRPFYSGKYNKHGMNLQVIASPGGDVLWVSGAASRLGARQEGQVDLGRAGRAGSREPGYPGR